MFFKRKHRNRRHTRGYVLDVKLSASQRRETRLRRLTLILGSSLILFLTVFIVWRGGELLLRRFVYENPAFAIRALQIETDGVLSTEQLRAWAGVRMGDNLLALDLARVERDLKLVPAIESVSLERVLPGGLRVCVTEREPIAQVILPQARPANGYEGGVYTLDVSGHFMFPIEVDQRATPAVLTNDHLPILVGIPARDVRPGRKSETPQVLAALALVRDFERSPMAGVVDLKQIDVRTPGALVVMTGQGNELTFGLSDFDAQLRRWRLVHDYAQRFGKHINALDLMIANNAPMLWTDASGLTPPPAPKRAKVSPYKKKHV
jgi:cell division septal protein FtsQ